MEHSRWAGGNPGLDAAEDVSVVAAGTFSHGNQVNLAGSLITGDGRDAVIGVGLRMCSREWPELRECAPAVGRIMQAGTGQGRQQQAWPNAGSSWQQHLRKWSGLTQGNTGKRWTGREDAANISRLITGDVAARCAGSKKRPRPVGRAIGAHPEA